MQNLRDKKKGLTGFTLLSQQTRIKQIESDVSTQYHKSLGDLCPCNVNLFLEFYQLCLGYFGSCNFIFVVLVCMEFDVFGGVFCAKGRLYHESAYWASK
jgi:hypothetical protein